MLMSQMKIIKKKKKSNNRRKNKEKDELLSDFIFEYNFKCLKLNY